MFTLMACVVFVFLVHENTQKSRIHPSPNQGMGHNGTVVAPIIVAVKKKKRKEEKVKHCALIKVWYKKTSG